MPKCKICQRTIINEFGPTDSNILIAGEFPGEAEIKQGIPFVGPTGKILRNELARVGLNLDFVRRTNLWVHEYKPSMMGETKHFEWHLARLLLEMGKHDHVLLLGSEMAKIFLPKNKNITSVNGLWLTSTYFKNPALFCMNPAATMHGALGEVRLAIEKFAEKAAYDGLINLPT